MDSDADFFVERALEGGAHPSPGEVAELRQQILAKLTYELGGDPTWASKRDWFVAAALTVRDRVIDQWRRSKARIAEHKAKQVYYLSAEFLTGRLLSEALGNLGLTETLRAALADLDVDLERIYAQEPDPALGNGGLGRLAACFMESMATQSIPAFGYGIRYEHGLFRQVFEDGRQFELPEDWLSQGNPWEFRRPDLCYEIGFGGVAQTEPGADGQARAVWRPAETLHAIAYDTPVVGWRGLQVNTLRLWSARASEPLRLAEFNRGDHFAAHADRIRAEVISRVLYPGDESDAGRELRLRQEYFFASASLQDLLRRHRLLHGKDLSSLASKAAIQLNDTHPAIAVAELMRLLVDVHGMAWQEAWRITSSAFSYTNHTLLPEALETWAVGMMQQLLPRHMQIIYQINAQHLDHARRDKGASDALLAEVSLIDEQNGRRVRMGHLAFVGSHKINGVSALHTKLMRKTVFAALDRVCPGRIVNKTNGITFRRWLHRANPGLTRVLVETLGEAVLSQPEALEGLAAYGDDSFLRERLLAQRRVAKQALAGLIAEQLGIEVDPAAMFDVQIKRVHEYKRQLLNILETIALYQAMRDDPSASWVPRVKILAGKAAASYRQAKLIIRLAHDVAKVVDRDAAVRGLLKLAYLPNYNVSLAEAIVPAADVSEQISTAGMEASGTGNMKLALNGALTIGTLDGANVEIREHVGADNIMIFGLTADEVAARKRAGLFDGRANIAASPALARVIGALAAGVFSPDEPDRYRPLVDALVDRDAFMVTADFDAYCVAQARLDQLWANPAAWWRMSILNTAHMGWFSSDRTIREYAEDIWGVPTH
jgi:starch phosphorylase